MKRFEWEEMRRYWRAHSSSWSGLDFEEDPDGLTNVCFAGAPLWLNRHFARSQSAVYQALLAQAPAPAPGAQALDVGCGAGRWCRELARRGYQPTGVDLQPELMEVNRKRYPDMRFVCGPIQELAESEPFDLVSSVTVLQHNPREQQEAIAAKLRSLIKPGGHALILENIREQAPHVFANSIDEWTSMFARRGFSLVAVRRYDYNPFFRLQAWTARGVKRGLALLRPAGKDQSPEDAAREKPGAIKAAGFGVKRAAIALDGLIEPLCIRANFPLPTLHCGLLFKADHRA